MNDSVVTLLDFQFMKVPGIVHADVLFQNFILKTGLETKVYSTNLSFELQIIKGSVKICLDMLEGSLEMKW